MALARNVEKKQHQMKQPAPLSTLPTLLVRKEVLGQVTSPPLSGTGDLREAPAVPNRAIVDFKEHSSQGTFVAPWRHYRGILGSLGRHSGGRHYHLQIS